MDSRTLVEDVLANGVDDLVYEALVWTVAGRTGALEPAARRDLSIGLLAELLVSGLMVAGEYDGTDHRPWDLSTGDAIVRIAEDWLQWGESVPTPGSVVWLALTPAGRVLGEAVLAREAE
jgi:hypothetical protein